MNLQPYEAMAKLELTEDERRELSGKLETLLKAFEPAQNIDTSGTEPLVTVLTEQNILREDISMKMLSREELLSGAPEQYDGYFQVPKTLD
ncbi:MAG TPA: Asp-tRNA(Asn)/Glu-tRNA(Gln) amidotransferase GatCAB subunit C [Ruminococcaceae bacterium]|nr:Asp-tRNA(Asn)/Glu-tRNA(Gln) amidotransferase GatCAB subunit C [Oscillospiraceae bacterium]